jgi:hypothetical protein
MNTTKTRRILYNSDGWNIFANYAHRGQKLTVDHMKGYVTEVANAQVDTFILCVNAGLLYYPDGPVPMYGDPGHPTDCYDAVVGKNLRALVDQGLDPIGILIDQIRVCGMECILSFRMNDAHHVDEDTPMMPDFWKKHPNWRTDPKAHFGGGAYNFAVPEVRAFVLDQLRDIIARYGNKIAGLELDWLRFPRLFNPGQEKLDALNQFTREVRAFVKTPLQLGARVWHRPELCGQFGMDPFTWAKEGSIDFLTLSRFLRNGEGPLEVQGFKSRIKNIPVYGSIEAASHNVWPTNDVERALYNEKVRPHLLTTPEEFRNEARQLWADGIDGIYLFNFFTCRENGREPEFSLLKELGDPKTIRTPSGPTPYFASVAELLAQLKK